MTARIEPIARRDRVSTHMLRAIRRPEELISFRPVIGTVAEDPICCDFAVLAAAFDDFTYEKRRGRELNPRRPGPVRKIFANFVPLSP